MSAEPKCHSHNDYLCPAHACAPAEACHAPGERAETACNPYHDGRCPTGDYEHSGRPA